MPVALENHENSYSLSSKKENFDLEHSINKLQDILKLKLNLKIMKYLLCFSLKVIPMKKLQKN